MEPEEQLVILRLRSPRIYRNPSPPSSCVQGEPVGHFRGSWGCRDSASPPALELDSVSLTPLCHLWGHL